MIKFCIFHLICYSLFSKISNDFMKKDFKSVTLGDFSARGCCLKNYLHFLKIYLNFCFFFANFIEYGRLHFRYFSNLTLDFFKNKFWDLRPNWILLCVSEDRSQKLILASYDLLSITFLVISDLIYWEFLLQIDLSKDSLFYNDSSYARTIFIRLKFV